MTLTFKEKDKLVNWLIKKRWWSNGIHEITQDIIDEYWDSLRDSSACFCSFCRDGWPSTWKEPRVTIWADTLELIEKRSSKFHKDNIGRHYLEILHRTQWPAEEIDDIKACRGERDFTLEGVISDLVNTGIRPINIMRILKTQEFKKVVRELRGKENSNFDGNLWAGWLVFSGTTTRERLQSSGIEAEDFEQFVRSRIPSSYRTRYI